MSNITLNVSFLAGTDICEAITEAKQLATKLDIAFVDFDFNGVKCSISQRACVDEAVKSLDIALSSEKMKFIIH